MTDSNEVTYCSYDCGKPSVGERIVGLTSNGDEIVELVCYELLNMEVPSHD